MKLPSYMRLNQSGGLHLILPLVIVLVVGVGGAFYLVSSNAATAKKSKAKNIRLVVRVTGENRDKVCSSILNASFYSPQSDPNYYGGYIGASQTNTNAEKCRSKKIKVIDPGSSSFGGDKRVTKYIYHAEYRLNAKVTSYLPTSSNGKGKIFDNYYKLELASSYTDFRFKEESVANGYKLRCKNINGVLPSVNIQSPLFGKLSSKRIINLELVDKCQDRG